MTLNQGQTAQKTSKYLLDENTSYAQVLALWEPDVNDGGTSLTRFVSQAQQFTEYAEQEGNMRVVVWALKDPANATRSLQVLENAGVPVDKIDFIYGISGLHQYLQAWLQGGV